MKEYISNAGARLGTSLGGWLIRHCDRISIDEYKDSQDFLADYVKVVRAVEAGDSEFKGVQMQWDVNLMASITVN